MTVLIALDKHRRGVKVGRGPIRGRRQMIEHHLAGLERHLRAMGLAGEAAVAANIRDELVS